MQCETAHSRVNELERDHGPLVVLHRKQSVVALNPLLRPILQWCVQATFGVTSEPMLDYVLPRLLLGTTCSIRILNGDIGDEEASFGDCVSRWYASRLRARKGSGLAMVCDGEESIFDPLRAGRWFGLNRMWKCRGMVGY
jgi:hypothetical protein